MRIKILNKIENLVIKGNYSKAEIIIKRNSSDVNVLSFYMDILFKKRKYKLVTSTYLKFCKNINNEHVIKIFSLSLIETRNFSKALIYLKKLVSLNSSSDNLSLLAIAYSKNHQNTKAIDTFEMSIKSPDANSIAYINYANFLREEDKNKQAIRILLQCNESSGNLNILTNIIGIYRDLQDYDNSLVFCNKAISIDKNNIDLLLILGTILLEKGDSEKALEIFKKILEIYPFYGPAYRLISLMKTSINELELEKMITFLNDSNHEEISNIHLGLAISNILEFKKKYSESFSFLEKFNGKFKSLIEYDFNSYKIKFERIKEIYETLSINRLKNIKSKPIFILGLPRSGTSLIEQVLSNHKRIFPCGELPYLEKVMKRSVEGVQNYTDTSNCIYENYVNKVKLNFDINCDFYTDKMPLNFFYIGIINRVFPDSKVLLCTRNLMDNMCSIFRNFFPAGNQFSYKLEDIKEFIELYKSIISYWKNEKADFYEIKYEKLVLDFEKEVQQIFNFINLDFNSEYLDFHKNKRVVQTASLIQVKQPLFKSSLNQWKNYDKEFVKNWVNEF